MRPTGIAEVQGHMNEMHRITKHTPLAELAHGGDGGCGPVTARLLEVEFICRFVLVTLGRGLASNDNLPVLTVAESCHSRMMIEGLRQGETFHAARDRVGLDLSGCEIGRGGKSESARGRELVR